MEVYTINALSRAWYGEEVGNFHRKHPRLNLPANAIGGLTSIGFLGITNRVLQPPAAVFPELPNDKVAGVRATIDYTGKSVKNIKTLPWKYYGIVTTVSGVIGGLVSASIQIAAS